MQGSAVIPGLRYKDAHAMIAWLERAFGFVRHAVYDGPENTVMHAELTFGTGMIMIGSDSNAGWREHAIHPQATDGRVTTSLSLIVEDCRPIYASAKAAGATVVRELAEMEYGGRSFLVRDPEGYLWSVGEYDPWKPKIGA
jgi:uncharacterized glyoxalase superfamily protein PhnB